MKTGIHPLENFITETAIHEFVHSFSGPQSIPVTYNKFFSVPFSSNWFMVNFSATFIGEITEHPHIMVAGKNMNGNFRIGEFRNFSKQSRKSFGNNLRSEERRVGKECRS